MSPYQILFERERSLGNFPNEPPKECEDAQQCFDRMKETDEKVARLLNEKHKLVAQRMNANHPEVLTYEVGQKVWYLRPENSGDKWHSKWIGPEVITARLGEHSYEIQVEPRLKIQAHAAALKQHFEDNLYGEPL